MRQLRRLVWFIFVVSWLLLLAMWASLWFRVEASALDIEATIRHYAEMYGMESEYLICIARAESDMDPNAVGDDGKAVGVFQWHAPSWILVRNAMGLPAYTWLRLDPQESARTAAHAIGVMSLGRWWTTARRCR